MAYYHLVVEAKENLGKHDELRIITMFDIAEIKSLLVPILQPYAKKQNITIHDETLAFSDIEHLSIKQTVLPIQQLIEQEQRELPSNTDVTITAFEIFNDRDLTQDVTQVVFELLDAL